MKTGGQRSGRPPGKVLSVRDGLPDRQPTKEEIEEMLINAKGCGNGVLLDHGNGWQSIYCHMRGGTIAVKKGDNVTAGQKLGEIGQSGAAEFPHLHFGLFQNKKVIRSVQCTPANAGCGKSRAACGWKASTSIMNRCPSSPTASPPMFRTSTRSREASGIATSSPAIDVLAFWAGPEHRRPRWKNLHYANHRPEGRQQPPVLLRWSQDRRSSSARRL